MSKDNGIDILVIGRSFDLQQRGFLDDTLRVNNVSSKTICDQLSHLTNVITDVMNEIETDILRYSLNEVTVKLEISASGQIAILGNGVSGSGTGGIELKFTRNSTSTGTG